MKILAVNAGSTSIKLDLYQVGPQDIHKIRSQQGESGQHQAEELLSALLPEANELHAVVHRVVHGGVNLVDSRFIDRETERHIEQLSRLAPLHNPVALQWIQACRRYTNLPQVAVFDTAYFANLPDIARNYAIPLNVATQYHIRRYGFHGIAHKAMWQHWSGLRPDLPHGGKLISIHLGGGCSITASSSGKPLDTSMGFSPTEGLVMATRCGDIDPGIILQLLREAQLTPAGIEQLLNEQSGLLGLSGKSADLRQLMDDPDPGCRLAVDSYCYRIRKYIGAYLAVLEGADGIVFGGGVGENMPRIRAQILGQLSWCGIQLDQKRNALAVGDDKTEQWQICTRDSSVDVRVLPVDESLLMVEEARRLLEA